MKSKLKILSLLTFIIILSFTCLWGDEISVSSSVDKSEITIGDKIIYSIKVVHEKDIKVDLPSPGANLGQFDILDFHELDPVEENSIVTKVFEYTISSYAVGDYKIPPIKIRCQNMDKEPRELITDEILIKVKSVANPEEQDIRDIKDVVDITPDPAIYHKIGAGILIIVILVLLIIYYVRHRRRLKEMKIEEASQPKYPPHKEAYMSLQSLEKKELYQKGKIKAFYIEFSEIIRIYVGRRYEVDALEQTTHELLENLKDFPVEPLLSEILDESDFVKYAKYRPPQEEIKVTLQKGYEFVEKTKKIEITEIPQPETESMIKD